MIKPNNPLSSVEGNVLDNINLPPGLRSLFGKPPLLPHEDANAYWALLSALANYVRPNDAIEWVWLKSVLNLIWEISRLHRIIAALIGAGRRAAVAEILKPTGFDQLRNVRGFSDDLWDEPREVADQWFDPKTRSKVETRLEKSGLDAESISAVSFSMHAVTLEAAEKMLAAKEIRLSNTLREIEDRRERLGRLLREASERVIDSQRSLSKVEAAE